MNEESKGGKTAPTQVLMANEQWLQQQLAEEVAERAPTFSVGRPGGFSLRSDGTPVDAHGVEIPEDELSSEESKAVSEHKKATKSQADQQKDAEEERAKLAAEAAKVQRAADKKNEEATNAAIAAGRAQRQADAGPPPRRPGGAKK